MATESSTSDTSVTRDVPRQDLAIKTVRDVPCQTVGVLQEVGCGSASVNTRNIAIGCDTVFGTELVDEASYAPPHKTRRDIGVGDGDVFVDTPRDDPPLQVRMSQDPCDIAEASEAVDQTYTSPPKSTRNVGILCKTSTRQVGCQVPLHYRLPDIGASDVMTLDEPDQIEMAVMQHTEKFLTKAKNTEIPQHQLDHEQRQHTHPEWQMVAEFQTGENDTAGEQTNVPEEQTKAMTHEETSHLLSTSEAADQTNATARCGRIKCIYNRVTGLLDILVIVVRNTLLALHIVLKNCQARHRQTLL